ncbi:MAG: murein L,D-transpeptidase catalytic domain family protein [Bacteroidales bacterium]|nr:murein L,D-transpeptidase catalytic domain family protein [Bacteroidales bacterium]
MKKLTIILLVFLGTFINVAAGDYLKSGESSSNKIVLSQDEILNLYQKIELDDDIDFETFKRALAGYEIYSCANKEIITIIDYTKPSTEERLFIINLEKKKLLYKTLVAHGKNTGLNLAVDFSNKGSSLKSSPGFYSTAETYVGKHGYSLRLDGLEAGINDNARKRAIVIHGANYVSKGFIKAHNRLGRSWGCPAVPCELSKEIIDIIKGGSCLYIHANDENYFGQSVISQTD